MCGGGGGGGRAGGACVEASAKVVYNVCNREHVRAAASNPTHAQVDILKLDIDSFDCDLLEPFLQHRKYLVILAEINYEVPPPFAFARSVLCGRRVRRFGPGGPRATREHCIRQMLWALEGVPPFLFKRERDTPLAVGRW